MRPRCSRYQFSVSRYLGVCSDDMAQPLDPRGLPRRALGGVGAVHLVAEVEHLRRLGRQSGELVGVGHDPHRHPARVGQVDHDSADALRQLLDLGPGGVGQTHHVRGVRGAERGTDVPRPCTASYDTHGEPGVGAAQLELVRRCGSPVTSPNACANRSVPPRSGFSNSSQARSSTLMTGFFARPGCSPAQRALLAVQVAVGPVVSGHLVLLGAVTDDIVTHEHTLSQELSEEIVTSDRTTLGWASSPTDDDAEERP